MLISELITQLQNIKDCDGDLKVFMSIGEKESFLTDLNFGRAEALIDEDVLMTGEAEMYHEIVVLEGK